MYEYRIKRNQGNTVYHHHHHSSSFIYSKQQKHRRKQASVGIKQWYSCIGAVSGNGIIKINLLLHAFPVVTAKERNNGTAVYCGTETLFPALRRIETAILRTIIE